MRVIDLTKAQTRDTIKTLEVLLNEARAGHIIGLAYAAQYQGDSEPVLGMTGRFRRDLFGAIGAASYMLRQFQNVLTSRREG